MLSQNILCARLPSYTVPCSIRMCMYLGILSKDTKRYTVPCRHCMHTSLDLNIYIYIYIDNNNTDSGD